MRGTEESRKLANEDHLDVVVGGGVVRIKTSPATQATAAEKTV